MLCSVVGTAPSNCFNIIFVQFFIFVLNYLRVKAALPPGAEDEIILIEHLPGRKVHLQDFFWTGAEDAPPWLDPDQTLTFYETRTVHQTATVYVPGEDPKPPGSKDPGCISCIDPTPTLIDPDEGIGVLIGNDPGPRYWLLTVLRAGETVPPRVELRLARLYRNAFSRQQQRHLGLLSVDPRLRRAAQKRSPLEITKPIARESTDNNLKNLLKTTTNPTLTTLTIEPTSSDNDTLNETDVKTMRALKISDDKLIFRINLNAAVKLDDKIVTEESKEKMEENAYIPTIDAATTESLFLNILTNKNIESQALRSREQFYQDIHDEIDVQSSANNRNRKLNKSEQSDLFNQTEINVLLNNKSSTNETSKIEEFNLPNSRLRATGIEIVQVRMQNTTVLEDGSTRLIYSVHLGGKPVPAETAAKDMALLSSQEVALELGAPVVIQSEPYLKETRPLALSRSRDAWLLIGTAGTAIICLVLIIIGLIITAKKKRTYSAVSAPPAQSILKKDKDYTVSTPGLDNTGYTSETEGRTDGTSQRQTPASNSRTPATPNTPNTLDDDIQELSSDNEEAKREAWNIEKHPEPKSQLRSGKKKLVKSAAIERSESTDSMETVVDPRDRRESLENGCIHALEDTASPHSYLSMPSCKLFPSMRSVEPLSRILEPSVVRNLDIEFETPEMSRRENGFAHRKFKEDSLGRTRSAVKDPGVVGPIVWDLRKHRNVEEITETDIERQLPSSGPVGRARRRLHELLEDSFSLFGTKDITRTTKETIGVSSSLHPQSVAISPDRVTMCSEWKEKSTQASRSGSPSDYPKVRPRTSVPRNVPEESIPETGNTSLQPRGAWGSRPMSAGPFHRPNLPEVNVTRTHADSRLTPEDPAVPLIAAIRKELEKFTPDRT